MIQKRSRIICANEFLAAWVLTKITNAKVSLQICSHDSRAITKQPRIDTSNVYETILVRADWPLQGAGKVIHVITHVQCKAITESMDQHSIPFAGCPGRLYFHSVSLKGNASVDLWVSSAIGLHSQAQIYIQRPWPYVCEVDKHRPICSPHWQHRLGKQMFRSMQTCFYVLM